MGMLEKRAKKDVIEGWLPSRQKDLNEIVGGEIPLEIDWPSFTTAEAIKWLENVGVHRFLMATRRICQDDIGREAFRDAIEKVVFCNIADKEQKDTTLADKTLTMSFAFEDKLAGAHNDGEIFRYLEPLL